MTDHCSDCGRTQDPVGLCDPDSVDDDGLCPYLTIARLRLELAAAQRVVELNAAEQDVVEKAMAFDEGGGFGDLTAACARLRIALRAAAKPEGGA